MPKSKTFKWLFRFIMTAALLAVVFFKIELPDLRQAVQEVNWIAVAGMWLVAIVFLWLRSHRMRIILNRLECDVKLKTLMATTAITTLYSLILPGMLSSGVKWYILKKDTGQGSRVFSSMIYNQASELFVVIILGVLGVSFANLKNNLLLTTLSLAAVFVLVGIFLLLVYAKDTKKIRLIISWPLKLFPAKVRTKIDSSLDHLHIFQQQNISFHIKISFFTMLGFLGSVATYVLAASAVNIEVPATVLVWQCALIYLLAKLPISVGNLGVREITLIEVLKTYSIEPSSAFLMSMILFSNVLLVAIIGAFCQIFYKFNNRNGINS